MNLKIFKGYEHFTNGFPADAVEFAMQNRAEAIPELLEILEYTINHALELSADSDYLLHIPAIYLLAYFREPKAYPLITKLATLPDKQAYYLYGDVIAEQFKNILASVCDGDLSPIKALIENSALDEFTRAEALQALLVLLKHDVLCRDQLVQYFKELLNGKLPPDKSYVWSTLPQCCAMICPAELKEDLEKAVAAGKLTELIADLAFIDSQLKRPMQTILDELKLDTDYSFISEEAIYALQEIR